MQFQGFLWVIKSLKGRFSHATSYALRLFLLFLLLIPCWIIALHGVGDIGMYYAVSQYARAFEFSKIYGVNEGVGHFFYGPLSLLCFSWMPSFSYPTVRHLWILINTVSYIAFWVGLHRLYPALTRKETRALWFFVWVASIKAIHASFQSHNVQIPIAAALVWGEVLRQNSKGLLQFFSGWGAVLLGEVKVFPLFVAAFSFLRSSFLVRIGILTAAVVGFALPFLYFGFAPAKELYQIFISNLGNFHDYAPLTRDAVTLSLASLLATWLSPSMGMENSLLVNQILSALLVLSFLYLIFKYKEEKSPRLQTHLFALGLALMALVNTSTRPDYFIFFVPAFASLAELWKEHRSGFLGIVTLLAFALIDLISEWTLGSRELGHRLELLRLPVIGMIMLCSILYWAIRSYYALPKKQEEMKLQKAPRWEGSKTLLDH